MTNRPAGTGLLNESTGARLAAINTFTRPQELTDATTAEFHWSTTALGGGIARRKWGIGVDQSAATPYRDFVIGFRFNQRAIADGVISLSTPTRLDSATEARFTPADTGSAITGPGIPNGTTITYVSATRVTLSTSATVASNPGVFSIDRGGSVTDAEGLYGSDNGGGPVSWAFGNAQPDNGYRFSVVGDSASGTAMGSLRVRAGNAPTIVAAAGGVNGSGFVLALRDWGTLDHIWVDNTDNNTWALHQRGNSTTSNPVYVVQSVTDDSEQFRISAKGEIRFGADSLAELFRPAAGIVESRQNFQVKNFLAVGGSDGRAAAANVDIQGATSSDGTLKLSANLGARSPLIITAQQAADKVKIWTNNASALGLGTNGADVVLLTAAGSALIGKSAISLTATDGFPYLPANAGTPTGTPTAQTGFVPFYYDTTAHKIWVYDGGAWKATAALT